jgi:exosortase
MDMHPKAPSQSSSPIGESFTLSSPREYSEPSWGLLLAFGSVAALAFWRSWLSFPPAWQANRAHAFALAGFSCWLLWRSRSRLRRWEVASPVVLVPLALVSFGWALAVIVSVQLLHQLLLPVVLLGWWYAISGASATVAALPAFFVFVLTTPVWGAFVRPLQSLTVMANSVLLSFSTLEAKISGDYISIPAGVFEVARGCSGANYFESGIVVATIYALIFLNGWQARSMAVLMGALFAMMSNWIRVFGLVVIGHFTEMQSPLIKDHNVYGWVIFALTLLLYFVLIRRVEVYDLRQSKSLAVRDLQVGVERQIAARGVRARHLMLPTLFAVVGPLVLLIGPRRDVFAPAPVATPGVMPAATWSLAEEAVTEWTPAYRDADRRMAQLWHADSVVVQVDRFTFFDQEQGKEMISGTSRLVVDSMRVGSGLVGPLNAQGRMVNATVIRVGAGRWLAFQWYRVAGVDTHSSVEGKILEVPAWFSSSEPSEIIVVSTRCLDEDCQDATRRLFEFITGRSPSAD